MSNIYIDHFKRVHDYNLNEILYCQQEPYLKYALREAGCFCTCSQTSPWNKIQLFKNSKTYLVGGALNFKSLPDTGMGTTTGKPFERLLILNYSWTMREGVARQGKTGGTVQVRPLISGLVMSVVFRLSAVRHHGWVCRLIAPVLTEAQKASR